MVTNTAAAKRTGAGFGCGRGERLLTVEEVRTGWGCRWGRSVPGGIAASGPRLAVSQHRGQGREASRRVRRDDVESWLEEQRCEPVPPSMLHQLLGVSPVRQVARTLVLPGTGRRPTIALPGSLSLLRFAAPGAQGANPRPHPRIVRGRGRGLGAAGVSVMGEGRWW